MRRPGALSSALGAHGTVSSVGTPHLPDAMTYHAPRSTTRAAFHTLAVIEHRDPAGYRSLTDGAVSATSLALGMTDRYVTDVLNRTDDYPAGVRDDVLYHYAENVERGVQIYCRTRSTAPEAF